MRRLVAARRLVGLLGGRPHAPSGAPPPLPEAPWFDGPDAVEQVDTRAAGDQRDAAILRSWVDHGYAVVEGVVPDEAIDAMVADLDGVFDGASGTIHDRRGWADLTINGLHPGTGVGATTPYAELVALPVAERLALRDCSAWRIHQFHRTSPAADAIRRLPELERIASLILGVPSEATYSINFHNGSTQALHQDSAVFHLGVPNLICGAWIACEDIADTSGPLVFYPGSHRGERFDGFAGYPLHNLRTAAPETMRAYQSYVDAGALDFERHQFLARKGDVLFWHGMLIHGGDTIVNPATTRKSYVLHYIPSGADVAEQVTGPVNW